MEDRARKSRGSLKVRLAQRQKTSLISALEAKEGVSLSSRTAWLARAVHHSETLSQHKTNNPPPKSQGEQLERLTGKNIIAIASLFLSLSLSD